MKKVVFVVAVSVENAFVFLCGAVGGLRFSYGVLCGFDAISARNLLGLKIAVLLSWKMHLFHVCTYSLTAMLQTAIVSCIEIV